MKPEEVKSWFSALREIFGAIRDGLATYKEIKETKELQTHTEPPKEDHAKEAVLP